MKNLIRNDLNPAARTDTLLPMIEQSSEKKCPARKWAKRAGVVAFLFFLGKGLIWLGLLAAGAYYAMH